MSNRNIADGGELKHYGVIGMKWGVRRGRTQQAYTKASRKLEKLDDEYRKQEAKTLKKSSSANAAINSRFTSDKKTSKRIMEAKKAQQKLDTKLHKAQKWYDKMDATFKNTDIKMTSRQRELGKEYLATSKMRSQMKYMSI